MESVALNPVTRDSLNMFHLKGLRQILKLETTFVNRKNANQKLFEEAVNHLKKNRIAPLAEVYDSRRIDLFIKLVKAPTDNLLRTVTMMDNLAPHDYGKLRVGRPRVNWLKDTADLFFQQLKKTKLLQKAKNNYKNPARVKIIEETARTPARKRPLHKLPTGTPWRRNAQTAPI